MNYCSEIRDYASGLLGEIDNLHMTLLSSIVQAVDAEMRTRLRPGVTPEDCSDNFIVAGALLAVSTMRELDRSEISEFTAGTMRLTMAESNSVLGSIANRIMAPWYAEGIAFCGVAT